MSQAIEGGTYRHFKGGTYRVRCLATDADDGRAVVVYENLSSREVYVRGREHFEDRVWDSGVPTDRFTQIEV
jgi:hypothetical protein